MGFHEKNGLRYFQFDLFKGQKLFHAILTRHGGNSQPPFDSLNTGGTVGDDRSAVLQNHVRIYQEFKFDFDSRFDVWQVHGARVICANSPRPPHTPHEKADGILTDKPDITLFMRFADCVPILLYDPQHTVIGIIHAGWQGTGQQIARVAIEKMGQCYGTDPQHIMAGIGPSICQKCYEVGVEVFSAFLNSFGERTHRYFHAYAGRYYLDLWKANKETLQTIGVKQIEVAGICTACHLEDWYSHRAENGRTGRFGVLMTIEDN